MKYARIESGRVAEVGEFDSIEGRFHPSLVWVECSAEVGEGWSYSGGVFSAPPPAPPAPVPSEVTMRQARLALLGAGLLDSVEGALNAMPEGNPTQIAQKRAARIEWEYSQIVQRHKGLTVALAGSLGMTDAQIDAIFVAAKAIP